MDSPADNPDIEWYRANTTWHRGAERELFIGILVEVCKEVPKLDLKWLNKSMRDKFHSFGEEEIE